MARARDWVQAKERDRESERQWVPRYDADTLEAVRVARGWKVRGRHWTAGNRLWWTVRDHLGMELANGPTWQVALTRALTLHPASSS